VVRSMPDQKYAEALDVPVTAPVKEMTKAVKDAWKLDRPVEISRNFYRRAGIWVADTRFI